MPEIPEAGLPSFSLNGYSETPKVGNYFGVSWGPEIERKADTLSTSFVPELCWVGVSVIYSPTPSLFFSLTYDHLWGGDFDICVRHSLL